METAAFRDAAIDTQLIEREGSEPLAATKYREVAAKIAAYLVVARPAAAPGAAGGASVIPSPWETLGAWRTGGAGRT